MARIHGRNGTVYMGLSSSTEDASPLPFFVDWSISFSSDKVDVTAMGDANKVYVAGLPDASGSFNGFYDDATPQTYTAALDGQARKLYLYPSRSKATQYWYGMVLPDFAVNGAVADSVKVTSNWNAASAILKAG